MKRKGTLLIVLGLLLTAAALGLTGYNIWEASRSEQASAEAVSLLEERIPQPETPSQTTLPTETEAFQTPDRTLPAYVLAPEMAMPEETLDGVAYIGLLQIPALGLELPVISGWDYELLKIAPCRFSGSAYLDDLVIMAHNYRGHFADLKNLSPGDTVQFTDVDGNVFSYVMDAMEILPPNAVEEMTSGQWDLTLFTCTVGGTNRVAVRCDRLETASYPES